MLERLVYQTEGLSIASSVFVVLEECDRKEGWKEYHYTEFELKWKASM